MEKLLTLGRKILVQTILSVAILSIPLGMLQKLYLVVPLITGCILGISCWIVISYRILKSDASNMDAAKKSMQIGWLIRLVMILGTFIAAVHISTETFWLVVIGFFLMSMIMMINAIVYAYNSDVNRKK